jgi:hypothetical protein
MTLDQFDIRMIELGFYFRVLGVSSEDAHGVGDDAPSEVGSRSALTTATPWAPVPPMTKIRLSMGAFIAGALLGNITPRGRVGKYTTQAEPYTGWDREKRGRSTEAAPA